MRTNFFLAFSVSGIPNHSVGDGLEALGDLARNRMAVAIHVANHAASDPLTLTEHHAPPAALPIEPPMPCIDNSPAPSVGVRAAAAELELVCGRTERYPWDWARLQLHISAPTLSRDCEGEELRAVYHFIKRWAISTGFFCNTLQLIVSLQPCRESPIRSRS